MDLNALLVLAKDSKEELSLGKLLDPHSSIYNALTNPELDFRMSPKLAAETYLPGPLDMADSLLQWQSVHLPSNSKNLSFSVLNRGSGVNSPFSVQRPTLASPASVHRPALASILSNTSEEEESMVLVPSPGKGSAVMVFETDEESDEEDPRFPDYNRRHNSCPMAAFGNASLASTGDETHPKRGSLPLHLSLSFIMPKISLSDTQQKHRLTILTSSEKSTRAQSALLIGSLKKGFKAHLLRLQITHLVLSAAPLKLDMSILKSSDLVFVVNDGATVLSEVLSSTVQTLKDGDLPPLTVINVITTNYFTSLADIISAWRPYQIWKAPSLTNRAFLLRMRAFVDDALFDSSGGRYAEELEAKKRKFHNGRSPTIDPEASDSDAMNASNSMYDSLVRPSRPDYKVIERLIRSELQMSHSFSDTDPLRLSSDTNAYIQLFRLIKVLLGFLAELSSDRELQIQRKAKIDSLLSWVSSLVPSRNIWLICSFSMGLGVGITVASGAATVFAVQFYDTARKFSTIACDKFTTMLASHPAPEKVINDVGSRSLDQLVSLGDSVNNQIVSWSHKVVDAVLRITDISIIDDLLAWLNSHIQNIKSLSSLAMAAAHNGLEKTMRLLYSITNITV